MLDRVLVPEGAEWRYFKGESQPPPRWVDPDFDDSSWETGPSGFGYGPDKEYGRVLDDMKGKYSTLYIRHEIDIPAGAQYTGLILSVVDFGLLRLVGLLLP